MCMCVCVWLLHATAQKHRHKCPNLLETARQSLERFGAGRSAGVSRDPRASLPSLTQPALTSSGWLLV